jgi:hypothetical protein
MRIYFNRIARVSSLRFRINIIYCWVDLILNITKKDSCSKLTNSCNSLADFLGIRLFPHPCSSHRREAFPGLPLIVRPVLYLINIVTSTGCIPNRNRFLTLFFHIYCIEFEAVQALICFWSCDGLPRLGWFFFV